MFAARAAVSSAPVGSADVVATAWGALDARAVDTERALATNPAVSTAAVIPTGEAIALGFAVPVGFAVSLDAFVRNPFDWGASSTGAVASITAALFVATARHAVRETHPLDTRDTGGTAAAVAATPVVTTGLTLTAGFTYTLTRLAALLAGALSA